MSISSFLSCKVTNRFWTALILTCFLLFVLLEVRKAPQLVQAQAWKVASVSCVLLGSVPWAFLLLVVQIPAETPTAAAHPMKVVLNLGS